MSSFEDTIDLPPRRGKHEFRRRKRRPWYVSVLIGMALLGLLVGIIGATVLYFYAKPRKDFANSLDMSQLEKLEVASIIYDRHGAELGRIFVQNRKPVGIAEIPEALINALIATEDERFYSHDGVDKIGIIRAVILNIQAREVTQGASTITQQLARNAFELKDRSISRKVTEAFLANRIEEFLLEETKDRRQMKRKVLELYLNRIYFGSGFYGVNAAANGYFGKEVHDLSTEECATLVGLIKSPNRLSPFNDPEESRKTRNIVFRRMLTEGYLTEAEVAELSTHPLLTAPRVSPTGQSKYVYEKVRQQIIEIIGYEQVSEGGFKIHTTIDQRVQQAAEESLVKQLAEVEKNKAYQHETLSAYKALKSRVLATAKTNGQAVEEVDLPTPKYLQGALLMIENRTGAVVALVGGRDFGDSMYDRTMMSRRRPGTAFLPFVYAAAFENGSFPGSLVDDSPINLKRIQIGGEEGIAGEWGGETTEGLVHEGSITARYALSKSKIAATARLGIATGLEKTIDLAEKSGIRFLGDLRKYNASLLGRSETSMTELCLAYSIFPNQGIHPKQTYIISRVEDSSGVERYKGEPSMAKDKVIDEYTAFQISSCLSDALHNGTGEKAYEKYGLKDFPVAGKSGTDYGFADNWFIGYTSEVTCAVWAGLDAPTTIFENCFSSDTVLPIWTQAMNAAADSMTPQPFTPPRGAIEIEICAVSGELATDACYVKVEDPKLGEKFLRTTYVEHVRPGTPVTRSCPIHGGGGAKTLTQGSKPLRPDPNLLNSSTGPSTTLVAAPIRVGGAAEPVFPVGKLLLGNDPYKSYLPEQRFRAARPIALPEPEPEEKPESTLRAEPVGSGAILVARPLTDEEAEVPYTGLPSEGSPLMATPVVIDDPALNGNEPNALTDPTARIDPAAQQNPAGTPALPTPPSLPGVPAPPSARLAPAPKLNLPPPRPIQFD